MTPLVERCVETASSAHTLLMIFFILLSCDIKQPTVHNLCINSHVCFIYLRMGVLREKISHTPFSAFPTCCQLCCFGGLTSSNLKYPLYPLPGNWEMTIFPNFKRETPQFLFSIRQINILQGATEDRQHWSFLLGVAHKTKMKLRRLTIRASLLLSLAVVFQQWKPLL